MAAPNFRGTRDFFGSDTQIRRWVIQTYQSVLESYGFEQLETPMIELKEILEGKEGTQKLIKLDWDHKAILRFDHTVPLAAFMVRNGEKVIKPYRRYAYGPVFRDETAQAGRLRQFTQLDFDTVGSSSPLVDAEIPAINYEVLTRLGFDGLFVININDKRLLDSLVEAMGFFDKAKQQAVFRAWDKLGRVQPPTIYRELRKKGLSQDEVRTFRTATEFLSSLAGRRNPEILNEIGNYFDSANVTQAIVNLSDLLTLINALCVPEDVYTINPLMARGLDYYTGPIFETIVSQAGVGSITGGGRFDKLISALGGPDLPASGSSFGLERIIAVMEQLNIKAPVTNSADVFVTIFDATNLQLTEAAFAVASQLRLTGFRVEVYNGDTQKLGKQLDIVRRKSIPLAIILGPDELIANTVTVKVMGKGEQFSVPRSGLVEALEKETGS